MRPVGDLPTDAISICARGCRRDDGQVRPAHKQFARATPGISMRRVLILSTRDGSAGGGGYGGSRNVPLVPEPSIAA
jgi:hypothetical protein